MPPWLAGELPGLTEVPWAWGSPSMAALWRRVTVPGLVLALVRPLKLSALPRPKMLWGQGAVWAPKSLWALRTLWGSKTQ